MKITKNEISFKKVVRKIEVEVDSKRTAIVESFVFADNDFDEYENDVTIKNEEDFTDEEIDEITELVVKL